MRRELNKYILVLIFIWMVQSCAVGPNFHAPEEQTPQTYRYAMNQTDSVINLKWWEISIDY